MLQFAHEKIFKTGSMRHQLTQLKRQSYLSPIVGRGSTAARHELGINTMWLLIDDVRDLNTEAIARTPEAGKKLLAIGGWECLCLDHDLAAKESGYDILMWALEFGHLPSKVQLVTSNPVGRLNMRAALEATGYVTCDGSNFASISAPPNKLCSAKCPPTNT